MNNSESILTAIYHAIDWINEELPVDRRIIKAPETRLLGSPIGARFDAPREPDSRDRTRGGGYLWRRRDFGRRAGAFDESQSLPLDPVAS